MRATSAVLLALAAATTVHAQEESGAQLTPAPPPVVEDRGVAGTAGAPDDATPPATPSAEAPAATTATVPSTPPPPGAVAPAPAAGPQDLPPPPPSYGGPPPVVAPVVPVAPVAPRLQIPALDPAVAAELARLQAERRQLGIGGRIALMAAGFGGTAAAILLAANFALEEDLSTGCSRCGDNPGTIVFSAVSIVAFGVGLTGLILFIRRMRERRALDRRMRELRLRGRVQPLALLEW